MRRLTPAGTPFGRPMTRRRTLRAISSGNSRSIDRSSKLISVATSWLGRLQFSEEKAYSVR